MIRVLTGDSRQVLPSLLPSSIQCCVTSPPYWGLRDYDHTFNAPTCLLAYEMPDKLRQVALNNMSEFSLTEFFRTERRLDDTPYFIHEVEVG